MFIAYALHVDGPEFDQEVECADLDEALLHLREMILNETEDPESPFFECYGLLLTK